LYELLTNETGAKALQANMEAIGPTTYSSEELQFADKIMKEYGSESQGINGKIKPLEKTKDDPEGGSTDVGDVSYLVPEITLLATTAPYKSPWHSWVVVACGGMSIGHKGMMVAAKTLALSLVDLFTTPEQILKATKEFKERTGSDFKYEALLGDRKPALDYRKKSQGLE
jgi:aminobenzoyl-glutamate utilization protein B